MENSIWSFSPAQDKMPGKTGNAVVSGSVHAMSSDVNCNISKTTMYNVYVTCIN